MAVGLSFGSPLSGSGFDVTSTVSAILANLDGVETPWKNQITTIDSQDTVLSALGTILSTLSTDVSSLTSASGVLAQKAGSSSDTNVLELTNASNSAAAGTHVVTVSHLASTSSGYLSEISNATDTLSGSIVIQKGSSGSPQTITLTSSNNTLSGLASAINNAGLGVTASVLTDANGSRLSIVSGTSGANGNISVTSNIVDSTQSQSLSYSTAVTGANATLSVDGVQLTTSSNTVTNLIPGVTFQLLGISNSDVQVVITNYNSGVESAVNTLVTDYNSLISVINAQEGTDSSGNNEPLYGSPTLSMLQQNILNSLNALNPSGYLDAISATNGTTLAGSVVIQGASGFFLDYSGVPGTSTQVSTGTLSSLAQASDTLKGSIAIQVGSAAAQTITLDSSHSSLSGLATEINAASIGVQATVVVNTDGSSSLQITSKTSGAVGSMVIDSAIVDTSAQTIAVPATSGNNTISGLAAAINAHNIGVTAGVTTRNGYSTLTLASAEAGSSGVLTVTSSVSATSPTSLSWSSSSYTSTTKSSGVLGTVAAGGADILKGSIVLQVGSGTAQTITLNSSDNTISGLASAINSSGLGVTASVLTTITNGSKQSLQITSNSNGSAGAVSVTANILDTTSTKTTALGYTSSGDITAMSGMGITVNTDGSLSLDVESLDSVLNSDYSGIVALFQNANSWGANFSQMLTSSGTSSSTGILKLAINSNSSVESTLNADITREESLISSESKSLTTELNSANEILQAIPEQLSEVNELYSAITGYNQSSN